MARSKKPKRHTWSLKKWCRIPVRCSLCKACLACIKSSHSRAITDRTAGRSAGPSSIYERCSFFIIINSHWHHIIKMRFCYFVYNKNGEMKEFLLLLLTISKCVEARPTDYPSGLFVRPSIRLSACLHLSVKINWSNRRYACLDNVFWKKSRAFFFDAFQTRETFTVKKSSWSLNFLL